MFKFQRCFKHHALQTAPGRHGHPALGDAGANVSHHCQSQTPKEPSIQRLLKWNSKFKRILRQLHHWRQAFVLPTLTSSLQGLLGNRDPAASPPGHLPLWMKGSEKFKDILIFLWYSYDIPYFFLAHTETLYDWTSNNLNRCRHCTWYFNNLLSLQAPYCLVCWQLQQDRRPNPHVAWIWYLETASPQYLFLSLLESMVLFLFLPFHIKHFLHCF